MIIGLVITVVVLLGIAVVIAAARDAGPVPEDVALGYATALARQDYDAVYRMIDPELLAGRNRQRWIREQRSVPHRALDPDAMRVVASDVTGNAADVRVAVDATRVVPIGLTRRARIWTVAAYDGVAVVPDRR